MKIKKYREEYSFTQIALAKKLGVKQSAVSMWENGQTPSVENLKKLAEIFNCKIEDLI